MAVLKAVLKAVSLDFASVTPLEETIGWQKPSRNTLLPGLEQDAKL